MVFITGDFNDCTLSKVLPNFKQHVNIPTRKDKTIDYFYSNIKDSYDKCFSLPRLGISDHAVVHLVPTYKPVLKRSKPEIKCIKSMDDSACEALKGCFDCTDWDVLTDSCDSFDEQVFTISSYVNFCEDLVSTSKNVRCYPNNKPWLTKDLKIIINEKK